MTDTTQVGLSVSGSSEIKRLSDTVDKLTQSLGKQILKTQALEKESSALGKSYKTSGTLAEKSATSHSKNSTATSKERVELEKLQAQYKSQGLMLTAMLKNYDALDSRLSSTQSTLNGYKGKLAQVTSATSKHNSTNKKTIDGARQLEGAFRGAAGGVGKLWLAYGALVPMVAGFSLATLTKEVNQLGSSFEYMTKYSSSLSDNSVSLDEIRSSLLEIKGVAKTPTELADGYLELIKAGVSAEDALSDIGTAAKYATVGEMSLGSATEQLVTITKAFGKSSESATGGMLTVADTADMVAYAAQKSTASFADMQVAFRTMASLSSVANMSLKEAAAALMVMHDAGLKGTFGATSLRTAITRLINPSDAVRESFIKLGGSFRSVFDKDGNIKDIKSMMTELKRLKDTVSDQEWAAFSMDAFGQRGMNINILVDALAKLDKNLVDVGESLGFVDTVFSEVSDTTRITAENLKANFEKALIEAFNGERATEVLTGLNDLVTSSAFKDGMIDLAESMYDVADAAISIAPALTLVTTPLGWLAKGTGDAVLGYKAMAAAINDDAVAMAELSAKYMGLDFTTEDKYSVLESEIVRVKKAIYETSKAMTDSGASTEMVSTATADLYEKLHKLEAAYNAIGEASFNAAAGSTPLETSMLGIVEAAEKASKAVRNVPTGIPDYGKSSDFTSTAGTSYDTFQVSSTTLGDMQAMADKRMAIEDKESEKRKARIKKEQEEVQKALDKLNSARSSFTGMYGIEAQNEITSMTDSWQVFAESRIENEAAQVEATSSKTEKVMELEQELNDYITQSTSSTYDVKMQALDAEYQRKLELANDDMALQTKVSDWYALKQKEIEDVEAEKHGIIADYQQSTEDFVRGSYQSIVEAFISGEDAKSAALEAAYSYGTDLTVSFANTVLDKMLELGGGWDNIWDTMLDKMLSVLESMAASWATSSVGSLFEGWNVFHSGAWDLKDDEVPSILQKGEMVIPAEHAQTIRDNINGITDSSTFADLAEMTGTGITSAGWNDDFSQAFSSRLGTQVGLSLPALATLGPEQVVSNLLNPFNMIDMMSGALTDVSLSAMGFDTGWSKVGGVLTGMLATSLLGGLAPLAGAFTGLAGGFVGDALGDLSNTRSFEAARDTLESMGYSRSVQAGVISDLGLAKSHGLNKFSALDKKNKASASAMLAAQEAIIGMADAAVEKARVEEELNRLEDLHVKMENKLYGDGSTPGLAPGQTIGRIDPSQHTSDEGSGGTGSSDASVGGISDDDGDFGEGASQGFFADGGYIRPGNTGIVGEAGPEIVSGPATVTSAKDTAKLLNQQQEITIPIYIGNKYLTTTIVTIADKQITMRQNQGNPRGVTRI